MELTGLFRWGILIDHESAFHNSCTELTGIKESNRTPLVYSFYTNCMFVCVNEWERTNRTASRFLACSKASPCSTFCSEGGRMWASGLLESAILQPISTVLWGTYTPTHTTHTHLLIYTWSWVLQSTTWQSFSQHIAYFRNSGGWRTKAAYSEVNANCLVLAMDFICKVIKEPDNGGFLQGHGRIEAWAYYGWPCQSNAVPIMQVSQTNTSMIPQQTVQSTLQWHRNKCYYISTSFQFIMHAWHHYTF